MNEPALQERAALIVRPCAGFEELDACVELQRRTWGYDPTDVIPRRLFVVAQRIGGQVIGAFASGKAAGVDGLAGFALALPGIRDGLPYFHSHMLAVLPEYRDQGLGRRLKLAQREDALARGIRLMEWTFDPLEMKNAFFNLVKLGAIARNYAENVYGVSSARLQGGRPTDRLVAEWWMDSARVRAAVAGRPPAAPLPPDSIEERIELPAGVMEWKESAEQRERALALQTENRERFRRAFARGLAVTGFSREGGEHACYELSRWTPEGAALSQVDQPAQNEFQPQSQVEDQPQFATQSRKSV